MNNFLFGVNIAGAEFGNTIVNGQVLSTHSTHYIHPPLSIISGFANAGAKIIRYPFKWQRLQRYLNGDLSATEISLIDERVAAITNAGMICVLDMHNYMRRTLDAVPAKEYEIGEPVIQYSHFADVWRKIAVRYKDNPLVWFNLMNEPHGITQEVLYQTQQAAIDAIRSTGAINKILVSIDTYSSVRVADEPANLQTLQRYLDSANNLALDIHQYFDNGLQGDDSSVIDFNTAMQYVTDTTTALKTIGWKAFLGEFNAGQAGSESSEAMTLLKAIANHLNDNQDVWIGATLWAAGSWWPSTYYFKEDPTSLRFTTLRDIFSSEPAIDLSNAILNLDASNQESISFDIATNDVTAFQDISISAHVAAQVSGASSPKTGITTINGLNVISFNHTNNDKLNIPNISFGTNCTVFQVFRPNNDGAFFCPVSAGGATSNTCFLLRTDSGTSTSLNGGSGIISYRLNGLPVNWTIRSEARDALNNKINVLTIEGVDFSQWNDIQLGNHANFRGWSLNGDVCQILIFENLSFSERDAIESFLIEKWIAS